MEASKRSNEWVKERRKEGMEGWLNVLEKEEEKEEGRKETRRRFKREWHFYSISELRHAMPGK